MSLEDADRTDDASAVPITTEATSPSERSRSDKREVVSKASQVAPVPHHDATRFSRGGYEFHAFWEGLPNGPDHVRSHHAEFQFQESQVHSTLNLNQTQPNHLHVSSHDPAITQLVEQVAEARHSEAPARTEGMVNMIDGE